MMTTSRIQFSDLSQQKRFSTELNEDLSIDHNVDQAIEHFLEQIGVQENDLPWSAYSRGVRLDKRTRLRDLPEADAEWTVLPTVSAGGGDRTCLG
jgi:hypothetical protein